MKRTAIAYLALVGACLVPVLCSAWEDPPVGTSVLMTAGCSYGNVLLSIDFTVTQEPDPHFVGWIVERTVLGRCVPDSRVTDVMPWPPLGQTHLELTVTPIFPDRDELYRIWAITETGSEVFIYWPQRHNFAHAECLPGPTTVGYIVDLGGYAAFEPCPQDCWPELSFWDTSLPEDLRALAGTDQLVDLYGELMFGMEGDYIADPTWQPSTHTCGGVEAPLRSWDAVKAFYR